MERNYLMCALIGKHIALNQNIQGDKLRELIDEELLNSCMTPLGKDDDQFLSEILAEIMISVMGKGINRGQRRDQGVK